MKPNPKNFEPFIDPNGGEWIKIKTGKFKNTVWRPAEMKMGDTHDDGSGDLQFQAEFLGEAPQDINTFEKLAGTIISDILSEYVSELKEEFIDENSDSNSSKT